MRDVVNHKTFAPAAQGKLKVTVPAHGSQVFVTTGATRNEPTRYEAEASWMKEYQEISKRKTATFSPLEGASGGTIVTTLGGDDDNYMEWKQVFSKKGGDYDLVIKYVSGEDRSLALSVNDKETELKGLNGGSWDKVATKTVRIKLRKGMNSIRLGEQDSWAPNIDCIELNAI